MTTSWRSVLIIVFVVCAAIAGFYVRFASNDATESKQKAAISQLLQLTLPDPEGNLQRFSRWEGKVLVLNFWATWCAPCQEEIPELIKTQNKLASTGVQIVGIGVDSATKIRQFSKEFGINYPILVGDINLISLTRDLGNPKSGLPFTLVLDRTGKLVKVHLGILSEQTLEKYLRDVPS